MSRLAKKVALVTGVGAGIGSAISRAFAREGADLLLIARGNSAALDDTAAAVEGAGRRVRVVRGDVSQRSTWEEAAAVAQDEFGRIDIVVNSAAAGGHNTILSLTEDEWHRTIGVNLTAVYYSCQTLLPQMIERGAGVFVNVSSVNGLIANPSMAAYATTKSGLHGLTRNLALDFGSSGIRANVIAPGAIFTTESGAELDEDEARTTRDNYPMGRWGAPEDVAEAAVYLASDESSFVTGVILRVDGGLTIQTPEAAVRKSFRARWRNDTVSINE